jgi:hypothetical protein
MDIALRYSRPKGVEELNNRIKGDRAITPSKFIGEVINVGNDIIDVKNGSDQIHSFKIIGLDVPKGFQELKKSDTLKMLEVGDKVKVNIEEGLLTSIQKVIKNGTHKQE